MTYKGITSLVLALAGSCIANSSHAARPVVVVSEYTSTPEHSAITPVTYKSSDDGISWIRNEINNAHGTIRSISCNSKNYCVGVGETYSGSTTVRLPFLVHHVSRLS